MKNINNTFVTFIEDSVSDPVRDSLWNSVNSSVRNSVWNSHNGRTHHQITADVITPMLEILYNNSIKNKL
jgi:hypothetical protein